ncbi:SRPBCC family protein [Flavobacteriaceae bacterium]|jgi:hypothetical protein|nr:SRPBCC family protein [Flavobacteriaceae bacterium]
MNLNSPTVSVEKSAEDCFTFLSSIQNFEKLMPENISRFEVLQTDRFLFALKGMPEIVLQKKEEISPNKVVLGAAGGKLDFTLTANITSMSKNKSNILLSFSGNFNPMMTMMIKGPISKFIESLANNIPTAI